MSHRRFAGWFALFSCAAIVLITPVSGSSRFIVVTTTAELLAALAAGADRTILMRSGTYELNQAIQVPDNTALIGEGTMVYDHSGLPTGFVPESRTVIAAVPGVTGDLVTLGDGASLHGLVIQDVVRPADTGGVVVMVASRAPGASVWAQILECEIINPNLGGSNDGGATGRGLSAFTRNAVNGGGVSHEQAVVSVQLTRSIIRSPTPAAADSIFVLNNASRSHIYLYLHKNVLGRLTANGGVSRPDSTVDARLFILSTGNLYRPETTTALNGWNLNGGVDAPMLAPLVAGETLNNKIWMYSYGDRLEGFGRPIAATAGLRMSAAAGAISGNEIDLTLLDTLMISTGIADLQLFGARTVAAAGDVAAGDGNVLRVTMSNVTGSAPPSPALLPASPPGAPIPLNSYGDAFTTSSTGTGIGTNLGTGNRLVITGSPNAFSRTNPRIRPMPSVRFFTNSR